jgi:hypothetical protein
MRQRKNIKKFKEKNIKKSCGNCGRKETQLSSVKTWMLNVNHRYRGSGRPWVDVYSAKLCKRCFNSFAKQFKKIII